MPLSSPLGLGVGQSNQLVTGSRSSGVTYWNTTGKPLLVQLGLQAISGSPGVTITVDGVTLFSSNFPYGTDVQWSFVVPVGKSYVCTLSPGTTLNHWLELR